MNLREHNSTRNRSYTCYKNSKSRKNIMKRWKPFSVSTKPFQSRISINILTLLSKISASHKLHVVPMLHRLNLLWQLLFIINGEGVSLSTPEHWNIFSHLKCPCKVPGASENHRTTDCRVKNLQRGWLKFSWWQYVFWVALEPHLDPKWPDIYWLVSYFSDSKISHL